MSLLKKEGWDVDLYSEKDGNKFDVAVFQKRYSDEDFQTAYRLKDKGVKIVFDLCDNHFFNPNGETSLNERGGRLARMINLSDAVTVSTTELLKIIDHKNAVVIDDALDYNGVNPLVKLFYQTFRGVTTLGKNTLVWFGNSGSSAPRFGMIDLAAIIPLLNEINADNPIRLNVISDSRELFDQYFEGAEFTKHFIKWNRKTFPYYFIQSEICLIPFSSNPFTLCKSNNRVIQSLKLGIPVIADRIPSYNEEPIKKVIYYGEWKKNILRLIRNPEKLSKHPIQRELESWNTVRVLNQWKTFLLKFA